MKNVNCLIKNIIFYNYRTFTFLLFAKVIIKYNVFNFFTLNLHLIIMLRNKIFTHTLICIILHYL